MFRLLIFFLLIFTIEGSQQEYPGCAIVTLVYQSGYNNIGFVWGAETLGYSLRNVHTKVPMVALITEQVHPMDQLKLKQAGWQLEHISSIEAKLPQAHPRYKYIFSKLSIFNMINYSKVIYMDADIIVLENIDHLCSCPGEYAFVLRDAFLSAGMMVIAPSAARYNHFIHNYDKIPAIVEYGGGDQALLNKLLWDPHTCPFVSFDTRGHPQTDYPGALCYRLGFEYNANVLVTIVHDDEWQLGIGLSRKQPLIVHYTVGFFKPWQWWSYMIVKQQWQWWDIYSENASIEDRQAYTLFIYVVPFALVWWALIYYKLELFNTDKDGVTTGGRLANQYIIVKVIVGHVFNVASAFLAFGCSCILPMITPWVNMLIALIGYWTFFELLCLQFFHYLFRTHGTQHLPPSACMYRIVVVFSSEFILCFMMLGAVSLINRGIVAFVWVSIFTMIGHTLYILHAYPSLSSSWALSNLKN